ncbi:hypothetical protein B484DRAFT_429616 [Ochromonadaceae sp. CCMP2298]|nr:hypothetical protein B484DRAFT_429616 [Ochromonadaceae sp. CCMP2298]
MLVGESKQSSSPRPPRQNAAWFSDRQHSIEAAISYAVRNTVSNQPQEPLSFISRQLIDSIVNDCSTEPETKILALRNALWNISCAQTTLIQSLQALLPTKSKAFRAGYLRSLSEILGPLPTRDWCTEWTAMLFELKQKSGDLKRQTDGTWACVRDFWWGDLNVADGTVINEKWIEENFSTDALSTCSWMKEDIDQMVNTKRWSYKEASTLNLLLVPRKEIARALRDGDPRYAASTYAICKVLASKCAEQERVGLQPPTVYRALLGDHSLSYDDPAWNQLEIPDSTGFRGLCSLSIVRAGANIRAFSPGGMRTWISSQDFIIADSPIVAFESSPENEQGYHAAVALERNDRSLTEYSCVFPPNCLYRLKRIEPDGFRAPGGVFVKQKLLVVTATYRSPLPSTYNESGSGGKLCGAVTTLAYGDRGVFVAGLDALVPSKPPLTMSMEFDRDDQWTDWRGESYSLREEWAYVTGVARTKHGCTPGCRDALNDGLTLDDFCARANVFVSSRREKGWGVAMSEEAAFLSPDEVIAVRLYTGPCYVQINTFLRQIAACSGLHRRALASHPMHSFAATCLHLAAAVRKFSSVATAEESSAPLYRGVRGELKTSFWTPDELGLVCAVDTAFMSCSKHRKTPINYMTPHGPNVLWALQTASESDVAYHNGADISLLSQFADEGEVLFPPCTMLVVRSAPADGGGDNEDRQEGSDERGEGERGKKDWCEEQGCRFLSISVQPAFV